MTATPGVFLLSEHDVTEAAIIAVAKGRGEDRTWKGVLHQQAGAPWQLGNELLFRVRRGRGDLDAVIKETVLDAPYGWISLDGRRNAEKKDQQRFYTPKLLRAHPDAAWLYLFDPEARTLEVYAADPGQPSGHAAAAFAVVSFDERGRSEPHQLVAPPPVWFTLPVLEGWEGEEGDGIRERIVAGMEAWCAEAGIQPSELARRVVAALDKAIGEQVPGPKVYTRFSAHEDAALRSLPLGTRTLLYPTRLTRRATRSHGEPLGDHLQLFDEGRQSGVLDASPDALANLLLAEEWPEEWPEPDALISNLLLVIAEARLPGALYEVEGLRLIRCKQVVDLVHEPLREVEAKDVKRRDKRLKVGDIERRNTAVDIIWSTLDWLRHALMG